MGEPSRVLVKNLVHIYEKKSQKPKETNSTEHGGRIQSKFNEVLNSMGHLEEIVPVMHRNMKITDQERENIEQLLALPIRAKEELLHVIMNKPRDVYDCFLAVLNDTNQQHVVQILLSDIEISQNDPAEHPGIIARCYKWLTENLNPDNDLIVTMYRNDVLTKREREQLDCEKNRLRKNELLLSFVGRKTSAEYLRFLGCLEETNQAKVVNRLRDLDVVDAEDRKPFSTNDGTPSASNEVSPQNQLRTRIVPKPLTMPQKPSISQKPLPLSPKPLTLSSQPYSTSRSKLHIQVDAPGPEDPSSPGLLSPRRRMVPKLEKEMSQPDSPVASEISLKVASIRQSVTDVEDEIQKKKFQESAQINNDEREEVKLKEVTKVTGDLTKVTGDVSKATGRTVPQAMTQNSANARTNQEQQRFSATNTKLTESLRNNNIQSQASTIGDESASRHLGNMEDKLRNSENENEALRDRLSSATKKQDVLIERLTRNHEEKLKKLNDRLNEMAKMLEDTTAQLEEQKQLSEDYLLKERQRQSEHEELLNVANDTILALRNQLEEKDDQLRRIVKVKEEVKTQQSVMEELRKEKGIRVEQEKLMDEAKERIFELERLLEERETRLKVSEEHNQRYTVEDNQALHNERMIKEEQEKALIKAQKKIAELSRVLTEKEMELESQEDGRKELERFQEQMTKDRNLSKEREELLVEALEKNTELLDQLEDSKHRLNHEQRKVQTLEKDLNEARNLEEEHTQRILETEEKAQALNRQLMEKEQYLERRGKEKDNLESVLIRLEEETELRMDLEKRLVEANGKVSVITQQIEEQEKLLTHALQERDDLNETLLELGKERHRSMELERSLGQTDEETLALKSLVEKQETILQQTAAEKEELIEKLHELNNELHSRRELEKSLAEANEEASNLDKLVEKQEKLLKLAYGENEDLNQKLEELKQELHRRIEVEDSLAEKHEEVLLITRTNEQQERFLKALSAEKAELSSSLEKEKILRMEMEKHLRDAEEQFLELNQELEASREQLEGFREQEKEFDGLLHDINKEKRLRVELEQRLNEAAEIISILNTRLAAAETELKDGAMAAEERSKGEGSKGELEFVEVTKQLEEFRKQLQEKETELWKTKKELAKERLLKKEAEKLLAQSSEKESQFNRIMQEKDWAVNRMAEEKDQLMKMLQMSDSVPENVGLADLPSTGPALMNLRQVYDRPKRKKNHLVLSHAGILAREPISPNGDLILNDDHNNSDLIHAYV